MNENPDSAPIFEGAPGDTAKLGIGSKSCDLWRKKPKQKSKACSESKRRDTTTSSGSSRNQSKKRIKHREHHRRNRMISPPHTLPNQDEQTKLSLSTPSGGLWCWLLPHNFKPPSPPPYSCVLFPFPLDPLLRPLAKLFRTKNIKLPPYPSARSGIAVVGWWHSCRYHWDGRADVCGLWIGGCQFGPLDASGCAFRSTTSVGARIVTELPPGD